MMKKLIIFLVFVCCTVTSFASETVYLGRDNPFRLVVRNEMAAPLTATEMAAITKIDLRYTGGDGVAKYVSSVSYPTLFDWTTYASNSQLLINLSRLDLSTGRDRNAEVIAYDATYTYGRVIASMDITVTDSAQGDADLIDVAETSIAVGDLNNITITDPSTDQILVYSEVTELWTNQDQAETHDAVTIGTANGLSLSTQQLSLAAATNASAGAATAAHITTLESALQAEVDGSVSNEINTITGDDSNSTTGLGITIAGGGDVTTSVSGDTVTVTCTNDGTGTDDQTASEVNVTDANGYTDETTVEGWLDELDALISAITTFPGWADANDLDASGDVADDSHNHTTTTISGLDISDDTNLTAGDHITLTDDDLDVDDDFLLNTGDTGTGAYTFGTVQTTGTLTGVNYKTFYVDAGAMVPVTTNGAEQTTYEFGTTNDLNTDYYAFDATTLEKTQFKRVMPEDWDLGTIKAKFNWTSATGSSVSDTCEWGIKAGAFSDSDAIDQALGTGQVISDAILADDGTDWQMSGATPAITVGGTPALADMIFFEFYRNVSGTDDMTEDAWLLGVWIQYKTTATAPSAW